MTITWDDIEREVQKDKEEAEKLRLDELRDDFAMAALTGELAGPRAISLNSLARECYRIADEMMKVRSGK